MKTLLAVLLLFAISEYSAAQPIRGTSERQAEAKKPDLTEGGGNSSVGATKPELPADRKARFDALDLDDDGRVSLAEAAGHEEVVRHFDRADRNKDGRLTLKEYENLGKRAAAKSEKERRRNAATGRTARTKKSTSGTGSASMQ